MAQPWQIIECLVLGALAMGFYRQPLVKLQIRVDLTASLANQFNPVFTVKDNLARGASLRQNRLQLTLQTPLYEASLHLSKRGGINTKTVLRLNGLLIWTINNNYYKRVICAGMTAVIKKTFKLTF